MKVISVVRNFDMYNRLVKNNPFITTADFICFDNRTDNKGIPLRYNFFLNNYDYHHEDWFIFCHEDWETKENLQRRLNVIDKNCLYGPIGANWKYSTKKPIGQIIQSNKDGSNKEIEGLKGYNLKQANTFDCQCLIVHSSLINKYHLRFDEKLTFDLYIEDFCINAHERYNVKSKILQLNCQHWSKGNITERLHKQFLYLKNKYKNAKKIYFGVCFNGKFIGGNFINRSYFLLKNSKFIRFFYQKKVTKSGKLIIKICKIPIFLKYP